MYAAAAAMLLQLDPSAVRSKDTILVLNALARAAGQGVGAWAGGAGGAWSEEMSEQVALHFFHLMYTSCAPPCTPPVHLMYTSCTRHVHLPYTPHIHLIYTSCTPHVHLVYTSLYT